MRAISKTESFTCSRVLARLEIQVASDGELRRIKKEEFGKGEKMSGCQKKIER